MRIAQLSFMTLTTPADHPYGSGGLGSKYQGQAEPTPSRYHLNFGSAAMRVLVTGAHGLRRPRGGRGQLPRPATRSRAGAPRLHAAGARGVDAGDRRRHRRCASLRRPPQGVDAIVNLVAILDGSDAEFEAVNAGGPRNAVAAAESDRRPPAAAHVGAPGSTEQHAPLTRYWRHEVAGKQAVMESGLDWTMFEPSFVFGTRRRRAEDVRGSAAAAGRGRDRRRPLPPPAGVDRRRRPCLRRRAGAAGDDAASVYELGGPQAFDVRRAAGRAGPDHRPSRRAARCTCRSG